MEITLQSKFNPGDVVYGYTPVGRIKLNLEDVRLHERYGTYNWQYKAQGIDRWIDGYELEGE